MASKNSPASTPSTVGRTYSRRRGSTPALIQPPVETKQPKVKKFSAVWWAEVKALGAHRRAVYYGPLTREGNYEDDDEEEVRARLPEMAVPEPQQVDSEIHEQALSGPDLANRPSETPTRELRSKQRADNLRSIPPNNYDGEARTASLNLLASMALEEDQHATELSEPFTRRAGKEPVVSDEEDNFWAEYGQFFVDQDSEDEESVELEKVNREECEEEKGHSVDEPLSPANRPVLQRVTRSALKRQHTVTSVGEPAAKLVKKVIVIDSDEVTDHSDSDSKGPEDSEGEEEVEEVEEEEEEVEEEEPEEEEVEEVGVEAAEDRQVNAREVIQYNI